jgi:hypothetical protein
MVWCAVLWFEMNGRALRLLMRRLLRLVVVVVVVMVLVLVLLVLVLLLRRHPDSLASPLSPSHSHHHLHHHHRHRNALHCKCRRLALDRCFPQIVLQRNSWRGTHHIIIFGFFVVATSLIMILDGSVEALAGTLRDVTFKQGEGRNDGMDGGMEGWVVRRGRA